MSFSYFTLNPTKKMCVSLKNPYNHSCEIFDNTSFCNYLISFNNQEIQDESPMEMKKITHWWDRKWQISLDYYLNSSFSAAVNSATSLKNSAIIEEKKRRIPNQTTENLEISSIIHKRKTQRIFHKESLPTDYFTTLCHGLVDELFCNVWKYYFVVFNVENVPAGIYEYTQKDHNLSLIRAGDFRKKAVELLCGMSASLSASFLLVLTLDVNAAQTLLPYNRALRELYIDSGRIVQKMILQGIKFNLGGLPSPAMYDSKMCNFLGVDPDQYLPIYTLTMGLIPRSKE